MDAEGSVEEAPATFNSSSSSSFSVLRCRLEKRKNDKMIYDDKCEGLSFISYFPPTPAPPRLGRPLLAFALITASPEERQ
jgi:hypothetical protein